MEKSCGIAALRRGFCFALMAVILTQFTTYAFAKSSEDEEGPAFLINPVEGVWENKQVLVIDVPLGGSAFYTLGDTDPETAGLMYDNPVLLDVTGKVKLKVAVVDAKGQRYEKDVTFTVNQTPAKIPAIIPTENGDGSLGSLNTNEASHSGLDAQTFLDKWTQSAIIDYTYGEVLDLPNLLSYALGDETQQFEEARALRIDEGVIATRYIPLTLKMRTDEDDYAGLFTPGNKNLESPKATQVWRLVIRATPPLAQVFSKRDTPFRIIDWSTIKMSDKKYIYQIDSGLWALNEKDIVLDRTKPHTIRWQSVEYVEGNPVSSLTLPPKPRITQKKDVKGAVTVSIKGDSRYKFCYTDSEGRPSALYTNFSLDTFSGDRWQGQLKVGVYYDGTYQGDEIVTFDVNKKLPPRPVIRSVAKAIEGRSDIAFARKLVAVVIESNPDLKLFASIMGPIISTSENYFDSFLFDISDTKYTQLQLDKTGTTRVTASPSSDGAAAYKIMCYAEDKNHNKSGISQYSLIIDTSNYYIDATATTTGTRLGTKLSPFATFDEVLPFISENRTITIYLKGSVPFPNKSVNFSNNVRILGSDNAAFVMGPDSAINVFNSNLSIKDLSISFDANVPNTRGDRGFEEKDLTKSLFTFTHGTFDAENLSVSANFQKNALVINTEDSAVTIKNSLITASSSSYLSLISGSDSIVTVDACTAQAASLTAIAFSLTRGSFALYATNISMNGVRARVAELFGSKATMSDNTFTAALSASAIKDDYGALYLDDKTQAIGFSNNTVNGW